MRCTLYELLVTIPCGQPNNQGCKASNFTLYQHWNSREEWHEVPIVASHVLLLSFWTTSDVRCYALRDDWDHAVCCCCGNPLYKAGVCTCPCTTFKAFHRKKETQLCKALSSARMPLANQLKTTQTQLSGDAEIVILKQ